MLSSVVAILSGRSKIKVTALLSVAILLWLNSAQIVEIPSSNIGGWFEYGLRVSVLALVISLCVDAVSYALQFFQSYRARVRENKQAEEGSRLRVVGNFGSLSEKELFCLLFIQLNYGETFKVDINRSSLVLGGINSLFEQGMYLEVGGTKSVPRWSINPLISKLAEEAYWTDYLTLSKKFEHELGGHIREVIE